jgi:hypothetical protein
MSVAYAYWGLFLLCYLWGALPGIIPTLALPYQEGEGTLLFAVDPWVSISRAISHQVDFPHGIVDNGNGDF